MRHPGSARRVHAGEDAALSRAVRSLRCAETLVRLSETISEALYITTPDGRIVDGNPALLELLAAPSLEHLRDQCAWDLVLEREARVHELDLLEREGRFARFELQLRCLDGQVRTVLDTACRVEDPATGEVLFHGMLIDITPFREAERRLREQAVRDPLTGCFNRWRLDEVMRQVDDSSRSWGVVVVDVDGFKALNDSRGHDAGDLALVRVARRLAVAARAEDAVFRLGGDEFLVLLMDTDGEGTRRLGQRVRARNRDEGEVSISTGWAVRRGTEPLGDTIARADRWLVARRRYERRAAPSPPPSRRSQDEGELTWPLT